MVTTATRKELRSTQTSPVRPGIIVLRDMLIPVAQVSVVEARLGVSDED